MSEHRGAVSGLSHFMLIAVLVSTISACGFKLRGAMDLSDEMSPVFLQQNSVFDLAREVKALITANNIELVSDVKQSNTRLTLVNDSESRRILSVDSDGRAREYLLTYVVQFQLAIRSDDGTYTSKPDVTDTISVSRSLLFDPDAVLAVSNEAQVLYKDMRRDAARLLLLKLQAASGKR